MKPNGGGAPSGALAEQVRRALLGRKYTRRYMLYVRRIYAWYVCVFASSLSGSVALVFPRRLKICTRGDFEALTSYGGGGGGGRQTKTSAASTHSYDMHMIQM